MEGGEAWGRVGWGWDGLLLLREGAWRVVRHFEITQSQIHTTTPRTGWFPIQCLDSQNSRHKRRTLVIVGHTGRDKFHPIFPVVDHSKTQCIDVLSNQTPISIDPQCSNLLSCFQYSSHLPW